MQQYFGIKKEKETLFLDEYDLNHIKNVMRFKEGDKVFVVYEKVRYLCEFNKDFLSVNIIDKLDTMNETPVIAYVPILQEEKMHFILEKGTELGVTEFIPIEFIRCKYRLDNKGKEKKLIRWKKICKEASEQSRRNIVPEVSSILKIADIKKKTDVNILCSLDKENVKRIKDVLNSDNIHGTISMLFGPEGGITEEEEKILEDKGFTKTSLGNTVLRTETVIVNVMSIINYLRMWSIWVIGKNV